MKKVFSKIIGKIKTDSSVKLYGSRNSGNYMIPVDKAIEIVKQAAAERKNGWISCSSGVMPRANGWYLVTNHLGVVQEQRWSVNHWEKLRDDAVLAWRELPLPYQPKGE